MTHTDHGSWVAYKPDPHPENLPTNVMFMRRESDGVDWYEYRKTNFQKDTVKFTVYPADGGKLIVGTATRDVDYLSPVGAQVFELTSSDSANPREEFSSRFFDPATGTFTDQERGVGPLGKNPMNYIADTLAGILKRLEALERDHP